MEQGGQELLGADALVAARRRIGQHCLYDALGRVGLR
jgi:hypothetical protein